MKHPNNTHYHISHHCINQSNKREVIESIQPLYKQLWEDNTIEAITKRLDLYSNPYISLIEFQDQIIGFGIYHIVLLNNTWIQFRAGAVIAETHRNRGLYSEMVRTSFQSHSELLAVVSVRTREIQVYKSIYGLMQELDGAKIYPDIFDTTHDPKIPKDVKRIMTYFLGTKDDSQLPIAPMVYSKERFTILQTHFLSTYKMH
jgi:hypothetical protein